MAGRPGNLTGKKFSRQERDRIIEWVGDLYIIGKRPSEIRQILAESKEVELSERQIYRYLHDVRENLAKLSEFDKSAQLGKAIARLEVLFAACHRIQDYKGALAVVKEINEMLGLKASTKIDLGDMASFTLSLGAKTDEGDSEE